MAPASQASRWVFTLNNPTEAERAHIETKAQTAHVKYLIYGNEVGENGTPHLQGFVILARSQRLSYLRSFFGVDSQPSRGHFEVARGTNEQARDYSKKDGAYSEWGTCPTGPGQRSDIAALVQWGDDFFTENGRPAESPDVAAAQPAAYVRHPRITRLFSHRAGLVTLQEGTPRAWQQSLKDELEGEADDRKVVFFVDPQGGNGKTWFIRWYISQHKDAQFLSVGKKADLCHAIKSDKKVFLINVARQEMEFLQYPILENLKDRILFSGKYDSRAKMFTNKVHVVVFCNEFPDMGKMSNDRYDVRTEFPE